MNLPQSPHPQRIQIAINHHISIEFETLNYNITIEYQSIETIDHQTTTKFENNIQIDYHLITDMHNILIRYDLQGYVKIRQHPQLQKYG